MSTTVIEKQTKQESLQYRYLPRMQEILIKDKRIDRECVYGSWVERLGGGVCWAGVRVVGREEIKLINLKQNYLPDLWSGTYHLFWQFHLSVQFLCKVHKYQGDQLAKSVF